MRGSPYPGVKGAGNVPLIPQGPSLLTLLTGTRGKELGSENAIFDVGMLV